MKKFDRSNYGPLTMGLNMAVGMVVFTLIGLAIDEKRGGGMAFTLTGILTGLFYCGYEIWKLTRNNPSEKNGDFFDK